MNEEPTDTEQEHVIYGGVVLHYGIKVWSPYSWSWLTLPDTPRNREEMRKPHVHAFGVTCNAWFDWDNEAGGQEYLDCSRVSNRKYT